MPRLSIWNSGKKGNDYKFFDRTISEYFHVSGTAVYVHMYLGPHDQTDPDDDDAIPQVLDERSIQDVVLLENRDRKYSDQVYELRGLYNVSDNDFDLRQFGLFLTGDNLFIEFHLNDMINLMGRKIMSGDVLELPHRRDDTVLDPDIPPVPKFYVVDDTNFASDGYSATWYPHIWRVKVSPMTGAQEYQDILDKQLTDEYGLEEKGAIGDLITTIGTELEINEAIIDEAKKSVMKRNFETQHFYITCPASGGPPWIYTGDGIPPNGAELLGSGNNFPDSAIDGEFFLRTDYSPHTLFRKENGKWIIQEMDYRKGLWNSAHRILEDFLQNRETFTAGDETVDNVKQNLSKVLKPRADF